MKIKIPPSIITFFEASLMLGTVVISAIFPPVAAACCGLAIAVTSFRLYGEQREVLKGDEDEDGAIAVGYKHVILCSLVFISLLLLTANPILGPIVPFVAVAWTGGIVISLVAALCAGGYSKLKQTWKDSGIRPLMAIIKTFDFIISLVPAPLANNLRTVFARLHHWIGPFAFSAQIALFLVIAAVANPFVGVAGLSYVGLSFLRTQNLLPTVIADGLNKFDYWMGLFAGIFIPDFLMKVYTYYSIASTFISKSVFPRLARAILGKDYKFLESNDNDPKKIIAPQLSKNISVADFKKILANMPAPKIVQSDPGSGLEGDINTLWKEYLDFRSAHPQIKKRQEIYTAFTSLKSSPKTFDKVKYYAGFIPMHLYWYSISAIYYPGMPNRFFNHKSKANPYAVNVAHISNAPIILPAARDVDFDAFMQQVQNLDFGKNLEVLKHECLESSKFQSIDKSLKDQLEALQDQKSKLKGGANNERSTLINYEQELAKIDSEVSKVHLKMLAACRSFLNLSEDIPIDNADGQHKILSAYVCMRMKSVCESIKTGKGLGWGKSKKEAESLQERGKHVIKFCQDMMQDPDPEKNYLGELIVRQFAIEAGGFCTTGLDDVTFTLYDTHVANKLIEREKYSTIQKIALYAQYYRKHVFDGLYYLLPTYKTIKALVFHMSFQNRHDRATVMHEFRALQVEQRGSDLADTRKEGTDLLKELGSKAIALALVRLLISCEKGYSPEGIINGLLITEPVQCYKSVWPIEIFNEWKNSFIPEVSEQIQEIWDTGAAMAAWKDDEDYILLQKLLALLLVDNGVLELNHSEDIAKLNETLVAVNREVDLKKQFKAVLQQLPSAKILNAYKPQTAIPVTTAVERESRASAQPRPRNIN